MKKTEGKAPEPRKILPLETGYSQLAEWLGITPDEVKVKFEKGGLTGRYDGKTPTSICFDQHIDRDATGFATRCEICDESDLILVAKVVGYTDSTGVIVNNTNLRL